MAKGDAKRAELARKTAQLDERTRVVLRVYQEVDEVIDYTLDKLRTAGKTASCARGCQYCCSLEVPAPRAEAEVIVAWLRANRSEAELAALADRLRAWLAWYQGELPALVARGVARGEGFLKHSPGCVMLADGACSIYPVRPITCRTHFVSSPPEACGPEASADSTVRALTGIVTATTPVSSQIRHVVEAQGGNFDATLHLLPEWIAHLLGVQLDPWRG